MYGQGRYNPSQSGQVPLYQQQLPVAPPPLPAPPRNFQQTPQALLPRPGQLGMPVYQHSVPASQIPQFPPGGMLPTGQSYSRPPPVAHGGVTLPNMYMNSYLAPGLLQPPSGSNNLEMSKAPLQSKNLLPTPSPAKMSYGSCVPQQLQQSGSVQPPRYISPPLPPSVTSIAFTPASSAAGSSQISPIAPLPLPPRVSSCGDNPKEDALLIKTSVKLDLPSPPRPAEKIVKKIEEFCQIVAKNGPSYEDMAREKASGNPEFQFLFSGEPGSETSIAHDYFLWVKKKCALECKMGVGGQTCASLQPMGTNSSTEPNQDQAADGSHSPCDSDMEMEDDITQPDNVHEEFHSIGGSTNIHELISNGFDVQEELPAPQNSTEFHETMSDSSDKVLFSGSSILGEQEPKVISGHSYKTLERPITKVSSPVIDSAGAAECPSASKSQDSSTSIDNKNASAADCSNPDKSSGQVTEGGNPVKLIQDYASDESSENDVDANLKDACPRKVSSLVGVENLIESNELNLETKDKDYTSGSATSPKSLCKEIASSGVAVNDASGGKSLKGHIDASTNRTSNAQKIDKFGRLVREGSSDSDSDDSRYAGRHNRRRRSRSRSRSPPVKRRRSPRRRRRDRRSRSRSWSPRYKRSRSRSPTFRHAGEFSRGNVRRDKSQLPECFDFLRGKCYRGASCRYLHHDSEKTDGSRFHRSRQHRQQLHFSSKDSDTHEEMKKMSVKVSYDVHSEEMQSRNNMPLTSADTPKDGIVNKSKESVSEAEGPNLKMLPEEAKHCAAHIDENYQEAMRFDRPLVADQFPSNPFNANVLKSHTKASQYVVSYVKNSIIQQSPSDLSDPVLEGAAHAAPQNDDSSISDSSPSKSSTTPQKQRPASVTASVHVSSHLSSHCHSSLLSEVNIPDMRQPSVDYKLMPQVAVFKSESTPESFPSYMLPSSHNSTFSVPPDPSWDSVAAKVSSLPPYSLTTCAATAAPSVSFPFQQSHLPSRNEFGSQTFLRPYSAELPQNSQVVDSLHRSQLPVLGLSGSGSFTQERNHHQHVQISQESTATKLQSFSGFNHAASLNISSSKYPPDVLDTNQPSHLPDFGLSRTLTHYNPSASTSEQQPSSRYTLEAGVISRVGSGQAASTMNSVKGTVQNIPGSGGDQYDPLFDSIEPLLNSSKSLDHTQKWEASNHTDRMRLSGSDRPLIVEENGRKNETGGVAPAASDDNEEFGETADAEVGDVENESQSNDNALANTGTGEMEIDKVKSQGKIKKSKESRSMKHFRVALADFVKEVLKPSWRQGNMSKEAFKTVVKKTVDKVSGAMKSHQIPKSKAKIEQYIDSSQKKLTKLVMGYVDKYAKG